MLLSRFVARQEKITGHMMINVCVRISKYFHVKKILRCQDIVKKKEITSKSQNKVFQNHSYEEKTEFKFILCYNAMTKKN